MSLAILDLPLLHVLCMCSSHNLTLVASVIVCVCNLALVASVIVCDRFSVNRIDVGLIYIKEETK